MRWCDLYFSGKKFWALKSSIEHSFLAAWSEVEKCWLEGCFPFIVRMPRQHWNNNCELAPNSRVAARRTARIEKNRDTKTWPSVLEVWEYPTAPRVAAQPLGGTFFSPNPPTLSPQSLVRCTCWLPLTRSDNRPHTQYAIWRADCWSSSLPCLWKLWKKMAFLFQQSRSDDGALGGVFFWMLKPCDFYWQRTWRDARGFPLSASLLWPCLSCSCRQ